MSLHLIPKRSDPKSDGSWPQPLQHQASHDASIECMDVLNIAGNACVDCVHGLQLRMKRDTEQQHASPLISHIFIKLVQMLT